METSIVHSFVIKDGKYAAHISERLFVAQNEDKTFTYKEFETKDGTLFLVEVFSAGSEELKKILFMISLKLKRGVNTR